MSRLCLSRIKRPIIGALKWDIVNFCIRYTFWENWRNLLKTKCHKSRRLERICYIVIRYPLGILCQFWHPSSTYCILKDYLQQFLWKLKYIPCIYDLMNCNFLSLLPKGSQELLELTFPVCHFVDVLLYCYYCIVKSILKWIQSSKRRNFSKLNYDILAVGFWT